jgi:hypothetical protein
VTHDLAVEIDIGFGDGGNIGEFGWDGGHADGEWHFFHSPQVLCQDFQTARLTKQSISPS